jgi:hypothetical protein
MPLGYDVVAEAGCNWYLNDINICSLSKKKGNYIQHLSSRLIKPVSLDFL